MWNWLPIFNSLNRIKLYLCNRLFPARVNNTKHSIIQEDNQNMTMLRKSTAMDGFIYNTDDI